MANQSQIDARQAQARAQQAANERQFEKFNIATAKGGDQKAIQNLSKSGHNVITVREGIYDRTYIDTIPQGVKQQLESGYIDSQGRQQQNYSIQQFTPAQERPSTQSIRRNPIQQTQQTDPILQPREEQRFDPVATRELIEKENAEEKSLAETSLLEEKAPAPLPSGFRDSEIKTQDIFVYTFDASKKPETLPKQQSIAPVNLGAFVQSKQAIVAPLNLELYAQQKQSEKPLTPISKGLQSGFNYLDDLQRQTAPANLAKEGITPQSKPIEYFGKTVLNNIIGAPTEVGKSIIGTGVAIRNFGTQTVQPAITGKAPKEPPIALAGRTAGDVVFPVTFENGVKAKSADQISRESASYINERGISAFVGGIAFDYVLPGAQAAAIGKTAIKRGAPIVSKAVARSTPKEQIVLQPTGIKPNSSLKSSSSFATPRQIRKQPELVGVGTKLSGKRPFVQSSSSSLGSKLKSSRSPGVRKTTNITKLQQKPSSFGKPKNITPTQKDNPFEPITKTKTSNQNIKPFTQDSISAPTKPVPITVGKQGLQQLVKPQIKQTAKQITKTQARPRQINLQKRKPFVEQETTEFVRSQFSKSKAINKGFTGVLITPKLVAQIAQKQDVIQQNKLQLKTKTGLQSLTQPKQQSGFKTLNTVRSIQTFKTNPITTTKQVQSFSPTTFKTSGTITTQTFTFLNPTPIPNNPQSFTFFTPKPPNIPPTDILIPPPLFGGGGGGGRRPRRNNRTKNTGLKIHGVFNALAGSFSIAEGKKGFRILR